MQLEKSLAQVAAFAKPEKFEDLRRNIDVEWIEEALQATGTATVNGVNVTHPTTRSVTIEHAGPLTAIVVVEGAYNMASVGGGGLSSLRRYVFTAGSPTAMESMASDGGALP